jgi:hypothetical protein
MISWSVPGLRLATRTGVSLVYWVGPFHCARYSKANSADFCSSSLVKSEKEEATLRVTPEQIHAQVCHSCLIDVGFLI